MKIPFGRESALVIAIAAAAAAIPAVALGDPPAVGPPPIPGPFVGAPTNSDPKTGQFSIDVTNRAIGRAPGHYGRLIKGARVGRRQASSAAVTTAREKPAVDKTFDGLHGKLRTLDAAQSTAANGTATH